jgi:hypothetical protein
LQAGRRGSGSIAHVDSQLKLNEGPTMQAIPEISIDLTAQELNDPSTVTPIEVDDIGEFDLLPAPSTAANVDVAPDPAADDDTVEIELTSDQMDAMLSVR